MKLKLLLRVDRQPMGYTQITDLKKSCKLNQNESNQILKFLETRLFKIKNSGQSENLYKLRYLIYLSS